MRANEVTNEQPLKPIPLSVSSWSNLVEQNKLIVDKTAKLGQLVTFFDYVFFSRPRRMGKTTLCSMLQELFTHGDQHFAGTAIYGNWPETQTYPVISMSFDGIDCQNASTFEANLCKIVIDAYYDAGFKDALKLVGTTSFARLTSLLKGVVDDNDQELVFLIDEWDHPLSKHLDEPQLFASLQSVMAKFSGWLRLQNAHASGRFGN